MPLYSDATLGVDVFHVQHNSGGTWVDTTTLQTNQKYRFRAYLRNYAPNSYDSPMFGPRVYVADLIVKVKLPGAKFDSSGTHEGADRISGYPEVDGHPNFNQVITPQGTLWVSFAPFTWIGPSSPVSQRPVDIFTCHREVRWTAYAPWGRLVAT